ncbi:unnamed protein product [Rotaria sp. Silwood1]|nr:unnamed protein product [Rotaria sp. Silwood1]
MNMYCNCGLIDRARELFNQFLPIVDHVAYSILMKSYLSINQPLEVLGLFEKLQSSSISPDSFIYLNIINACNQLGLMNQAEKIHRSIPSYIIERNHSLIIGLIDMHAHCLHLNEADRLFNLLKQKDNISLASLLHGYAINGQGQQALKLFEKVKSELIFNEQVYKMILYACVFTDDLVKEAKEIYKTIPDKYKTPQVAAAMVSILVRASLFDEAESFIHQYKPRSQNVSLLWSAFFMVCYHEKNLRYGKLIYDHITDDPFLLLLFSDMTNTLPSTEIINYFRQQIPGICWTEIENNDKTNYIIYEFCNNDLLNFSSLHSELNIVINDLKLVGVNWKTYENDLKELFCGHTAIRLAIVKNLISTLPRTTIQLTTTKSLCHVCHEGIKQLSLLKQRDIILKDNIRKSGVNIDGFNDIDILPSNASIVASIGIDFNDKTQPASFDISFDGRQLSTPLSISCHVGELFEQKFLNEQQFNQSLAHLRGMNEITDSVNVSETQMGKLNFTSIQTKVLQCANITSVPLGSGNSTIYRFSGQTISSKALVLITIQLNIPELTVNLTINSDRLVLATMLLKEIKQTFSTMT